MKFFLLELSPSHRHYQTCIRNSRKTYIRVGVFTAYYLLLQRTAALIIIQ